MPPPTAVLIPALALALAALLPPLHAQPDALHPCRGIPFLPTSLDTAGYLLDRREMHMYGEFMVDTGDVDHTVAFTVRERSVLRVSVQPHIADFDLVLERVVDQRSEVVQHSVQAAHHEESLYSVLTLPDMESSTSYLLRLRPASAIGLHLVECPSVVVELEIVAEALALDRATGFHCGGQNIPAIDFAAARETIHKDGFFYSTQLNSQSVPFNVGRSNDDSGTDNSHQDQDKVRFIHGYEFELPSVVELYHVRATLGVNFVFSGSLGLILDFAPPQGPLRPAHLSLESCRANDAHCIVSTATTMNEQSLHAALFPGRYVLWLFDHHDSHFQWPDKLLDCAPFDFSLSIQPQGASLVGVDVAMCGSDPMPESLNVPGFISETGRMEYFGTMLVPHTARGMKLQVTEPSYLRVLVEDNSVNLDLTLTQGDTVLAESADEDGNDGIFVYLGAGQYSLVVQANAFSALKGYCDEFAIQMALGPVTDGHPPCPPSDAVPFDMEHYEDQATSRVWPGIDEAFPAPNFQDANAGLKAYPHTFTFGPSTVGGLVPNYDHEHVPVFRSRFTLHAKSLVSARAGYNLLLSPVQLHVHFTDRMGEGVRGTYSGNGVQLSAELSPGEYEFWVTTATVQEDAHEDALHRLPHCVRYDLWFDVRPLNMLRDHHSCAHYEPLPHSLATAGYFGGVARNSPLHFGGEYTTVTPMSWRSGGTEYSFIDMSLAVPSLVHLHVKPNPDETMQLTIHGGTASAIDPGQFAADSPLARASQKQPNLVDQAELSLFASLAPGEYVVALKRHSNVAAVEGEVECGAFVLEGAVTPLLQPKDAQCASEQVPPQGWLSARPSVVGMAETKRVRFSQKKEAFSQSFPFRVGRGERVVMHVETRFTFAQADVSARIKVMQDSEMVEVISGFNEGNSHHLRDVDLYEGDYELELYELSTVPEGARACVEVDVKITTEGDTDVAHTNSLAWVRYKLNRHNHACDYAPLPYSFNSVMFMSRLSGGAMHLARPVLADPTKKADVVHMTVLKDSLFRVYVPPHSKVDVNIKLYRDDWTFVSSAHARSEETIFERVAPGRYLFAVNYTEPLAGKGLPSPYDCVAVPFEIAIQPIELETDRPSVNVEPESVSRAVHTLGEDHRLTIRSTRPFAEQSDQDWGIVVHVVVTEPSVLSVDLGFEFPTGGASMTLTRRTAANKHQVAATPSLRSCHAHLVEVLAPAKYTVVVHDPASAPFPQPPSQVRATNFFFDLHLITQTEAQRANFYSDDRETDYQFQPTGIAQQVTTAYSEECERLTPLPTDLFSSVGGSAMYGGPQDSSDSSVRIVGQFFPLPGSGIADVPEHRIQFQVKVESYLRVFVRPVGARVDMDIEVFHGAAQPTSVAQAQGWRTQETLLTRLAASDDFYTIALTFVTLDSSARCGRFHMYITLEPVESVQHALRCPSPLPNENCRSPTPPSELTVALIQQHAHCEHYSAQYDVKYHTPVSCQTGQEDANLAESLANFMFGHCGAVCVYSLRNPSEIVWQWENERQCWDTGEGARGCALQWTQDAEWAVQRMSSFCRMIAPAQSVKVAVGMPVQQHSENCVFTPGLIQHKIHNGQFVYPIDITVDAKSADLQVAIAFDFVANAFELELYKYDTQSNEYVLIAESEAEGMENWVGQGFNFGHFLGVKDLSFGHYSLRIVEQVWASDLMGNGEQQCHQFGFGMVLDAREGPHIVTVYPEGGQAQFDPNADLSLTVVFSEYVAHPRLDEVHSVLLANPSYLALEAYSKPDARQPSAVRYATDGTATMTVVFSQPFRPNEKYVLHINPTVFVSMGGEVFSGDAQMHVYDMSLPPSQVPHSSPALGGAPVPGPVGGENFGADDFREVFGQVPGRAVPDAPQPQPHAVSAPPQAPAPPTDHYAVFRAQEDAQIAATSAQVAQCAAGFHPWGSGCEADTKCEPGTCHGHGECHDASGHAVCRCVDGFASSSDGASMCSECDWDYEGYPDCRHVSAMDETPPPDCDAPVLPSTFDTVGFLGSPTYALHLSDWFYMDLVHPAHTTEFTLFHDSVFRLHVAPHHHDIDATLFEVVDDDQLKLVSSPLGTSLQAETIYARLKGSTRGQRYLLTFKYYTFGTDPLAHAQCERFQLELAIEPEQSLFVHECPHGGNDVLPEQPELPEDWKRPRDRKTHLPAADRAPPHWSIGKDANGKHKQYTVRAASTTARRFVHAVDFVVPMVFRHTAHLDAQVMFDFPTAHLALMLQAGTKESRLEAKLDHLASGRGAKFAHWLSGKIGAAMFPVEDNHCLDVVDGQLPLSSSKKRPRLTRAFGATVSDRCTVGYSSYNRHALSIPLQPGPYRLFIVAPEPIDKTLFECVEFNFEAELTYVPNDSSVFECDGVALPLSFNSPGFLGMLAQPGYMHVAETFSLDMQSGVHLAMVKVEERSLMRVYHDAEQNDIGLSFSLHTSPHLDELFNIPSNITDPRKRHDFLRAHRLHHVLHSPKTLHVPAGQSLFVHELDPGSYWINMNFFSRDSQRDEPKCKTAFIEMEVMPLGMVGSERALQVCASDPTLPSFSAQGPLQLPVRFHEVDSDGVSPRTYVFVPPPHSDMANDVLVWTHTVDFTGEEVVHLFAEASTNFFFAESELRLRKADSKPGEYVVVGLHQKNHNSLRAIVPGGVFLLELFLLGAGQPVPDAMRVSCVEFNFFFEAERAPLVPNGALANCPLLGEPLPRSLNSLRFLRGKGRFSMSSSFRQPTSDAHAILFVPEEAMRMRFGTFSLAMDIDLKLDLVPSLPPVSALSDPPRLQREVPGTRQIAFRDAVGPTDELSFDVDKGQYFVLWLLIDRSQGDVDSCDSFDLSISGVPLAAMTTKARQEECKGPQVPGSLPRVLPMPRAKHTPPGMPETFPTKYDSVARRQRLSLKPVAGGRMRYSTVFQVTEPIHLYAKLAFDFAMHSLDLRVHPVMPLDKTVLKHEASNVDYYDTEVAPHVVHGKAFENGRFLNIRELEPGWYGLTIAEITPTHNPHIASCNDFGLVFEAVAVSEHRPTFLGPAAQLPSTLDAVGLSRDEGWARMYGDFPIVLQPPRSNTIGFQLKDTSLFRAYAAPHAIDIDLYLSRRGASASEVAHSVRMAGEEAIVEVLHAGEYELKVTYMPGDSGVWPSEDEHVLFNFDAAVAPLSFIKQMTQVIGDAQSACVQSPVPDISLNRRGHFQWSGNALRVPPEVCVVQQDLVSLPFTIRDTSRALFQVGYEFLISDLALKLFSTSQDPPVAIAFGNNHGNVNQLKADLPAGSYRLVLYQPQLMHAEALHCLSYSLDLTITELKHVHSAHCDLSHQLPTDWNTKNGGTAAYGGPMEDGRLRMAVSGIVVPVPHANMPTPLASERSVFSIDQPTLVRVFVRTNTPMTSLQLQVVDIATGAPQSPLQSGSLSTMETSLWLLDPSQLDPEGNGRGYAVIVRYQQTDTMVQCPTYDLRVEVEPVETAVARHQCPDKPNWVLPKPVLAGPHDHDHVAWYIGTELVHTALSFGDWSHDMMVVVKERSELTVTLGYHFLPMFLYLELTKDDPQQSTFYKHSEGDIVGNNNSFGHLFVVDLQPGNYVLRLRANTGFVSHTQAYCFPYVYDALLRPKNAEAAVVGVTPASDHALSPSTVLTLRIRFSEPPFNVFGERLQDLSAGEVGQILYLQNQDNPQADHVVCEALRFAGYGSTYKADFFPSLMDAAATYRLVVDTNMLQDKQGRRFGFDNAANTFKVDPNAPSATSGLDAEIPPEAGNHLPTNKCGHGTEQPDGSCKCSEGFSGTDCSRCARGFTPAFMGTELFCFVECGPHGKADEHMHCQCDQGYRGPHCDKCEPPLIAFHTSHKGVEVFECRPPPALTPAAQQPAQSSPPSGPSQEDRPQAVQQQQQQQAQGLVQEDKGRRFYEVDCGKHGKPNPVEFEVPCECQHGFTGKFCDTCIPSLISDDSTGSRRCMRRDGCRTLLCHAHGECSNQREGVVACSCEAAYDGANCDRCAAGYTGFPKCVASKACPKACLNGGACNELVGECTCPPGTSGAHCERCEGAGCNTGDLGETRLVQALRYAGLLAAAALILTPVVVFVVRHVRARDARGSYAQLPAHDIDEDPEFVDGFQRSARREEVRSRAKQPQVVHAVDSDEDDGGFFGSESRGGGARRGSRPKKVGRRHWG